MHFIFTYDSVLYLLYSTVKCRSYTVQHFCTNLFMDYSFIINYDIGDYFIMYYGSLDM